MQRAFEEFEHETLIGGGLAFSRSDSREAVIFMNQLGIVLITAVVTGAVSMSGIWLGGRLTRVNEDRKWRRDRALEVYSEFLSAVEVAISEAGMAYGPPCGTEEHAKRQAVVLEKVADMHRLSGRIILLAPDVLEPHFSALSEFITTKLLIMAMQCPKASADERKATNKKLAELLAVFMVTARQDIGIHTPTKSWWRLGH